MGIVEMLLYALALAMDAFAVSICKGLAARRAEWREMALCGIWFGGFQALMPLLGYFLGGTFARFITAVDHWIAFALLLLIGGNMIREALSKGEENVSSSFGFLTMLSMAVATSIDALMIGVTFAVEYENIQILPVVLTIGAVTFLLSAVGVRIGRVFGSRCQCWAELAGGIVLILIGIKVVLEAYGILDLSFL